MTTTRHSNTECGHPMTGAARPILERWFESDVLRATLATDAIIGSFASISSPGSAYVLLHHYMGEIDGNFRAWGFAKGGTGSVADAIASSYHSSSPKILLTITDR